MILISIWYAQNKNISNNLRGRLIKDIHNLSINFQTFGEMLIETDKTIEFKTLINKLSHSNSLFLLGKQMGESIAYEGALKIKEVSYIHAEGYPGGALKHGPFALIDNGTPIIILVFSDGLQSKMNISAEEVKARGSYIILITNLDDKDIPEKIYDYIIKVPDAGYLTPLLSIMSLQFLSYKLALAKGHNPDFPRNLAKCVTTE